MPVKRYVVRVIPNGNSVAVDILDTSGVSVVAYDSSEFAASRIALPHTIYEQTDFCLPAPGPYDVSCKIDGTEVADGAGGVKRVRVVDETVQVVIPEWEGDQGGGGSAASGALSWTTITLSTAAADWTVVSGTWDFSTPGEIHQTDPEETTGEIQYNQRIKYVEAIIDGEVNISSGQSGSVVPEAVFAAGSGAAIGSRGDGWGVTTQDFGDGPFYLNAWTIGHAGPGVLSDIAPDTWRRLRTHTDGFRSVLYLDGGSEPVDSHTDFASYDVDDVVYLTTGGLVGVRNLSITVARLA